MNDAVRKALPEGACANTDRELWRERPGDFYAASIHVTADGAIGINIDGKVIVMPLRKWHGAARAALAEQPPTGLDAIRQAIEERDSIERDYHDLAEHMVYRGNSVAWWHSKATAYRDAIDAVWRALREAGIAADGVKTSADAVRAVIAERDALRADAERYRWLRHGDNDELILRMDMQAYLPRNEELDAAIDAARKGAT